MYMICDHAKKSADVSTRDASSLWTLKSDEIVTLPFAQASIETRSALQSFRRCPCDFVTLTPTKLDQMSYFMM